MPARSIPRRTRAIIGASVVVLAAIVVAVVMIIRDEPSSSAVTTLAPTTGTPTTTAVPETFPATAPSTTLVLETVPPTAPPTTTTTTTATTPVVPPPVEVVAPASGNVLFSTSFDAPGSAVDNGMLLPSFGPHLTPRPGVVANGAVFRDPAMTEWEDVLVRAPVGPLTGDRYIEAVVTVAANGEDAHPAVMFFDDPPNTSGGCAGGSTMDWAEVDPWNNMQAGRISFVVDGCYDATSHVFAGTLGSFQTYTVRAEIVGDEIVMKVNGAETARTSIPAGLDLPFAGLRLGQFGDDGGFDQYRIESFEVGLL